MAARTFVNKQVELMVWKCDGCGAERGYLEPRTTTERTAHLSCDRCRAEGGGTMTVHHVVPLKSRMFTVHLQL